MSPARVYLDNAASTPLDPRVFSRMKKVLGSISANASSIHADGLAARKVVEDARARIASFIAANPSEIIFTSGGTESNNLALQGVARAGQARGAGAHMVISSFEHQSVRGCAEQLAAEGFRVSYVEPNAQGVIDPKDVVAAITDETLLVSVMYANNEIGTIQPIRDIVKAVRRVRRNVGSAAYPLVHTDACQATGNVPLSVITDGVDLLTFNAHKLYGPKGIGALYVRRGSVVAPIVYGGNQESGFRSGTEPVAQIAGFAEACAQAMLLGAQSLEKIRSLRDYGIHRILTEIPGTELNGDASARLPGNINISFLGIESEQLVIELDAKGFAVSSGSACSSSDLESSYAILSLGKGREYADSAVRFSLGRQTTKSEIDSLLRHLPPIVSKLRRFASGSVSER